MEALIFKDNHKDLQGKLHKEGYLTMPFLGAEEVKAIRDIYYNLPDWHRDAFSSTSYLTDNELKNKLNEEVLAIVSGKLEEFFSGHKLLGCSFLNKLPGKESEMPIHQDWTVVDESKFGSYTIWIPLQDTTKENGAIQVIPGSHKYSDALRSPSLPISFGSIYNDLYPYLKMLPMKAGEAFLFNHALMHASPPNLSSDERLAVTIGLVPKDAELHMYYGKPDRAVEKYAMPDDMFVRYPEIRNEPQIGEKIETFSYVVPQIGLDEFKNKNYQFRKENFKMEPLFLDSENQKFFEENGYLKLPALDENDVQVLRDFLGELGLKDELGYGFHVGMDNPDKEIVSRMMEKIQSTVLPKVQPNMVDAQIFTASYVLKDQNPKGVVPPHQDWSFVEDETRHCSVTCWIPLQDVDIENGCIGVIKGSNRFFDSERPSPSPQVPTPLAKHMYTIFPYLQLLPMKAGEALFFDNRTIHASPPNTSDAPRLAVGLGFTQKEAEIRHYYMKPGTNDTLLKYKIDPEFFKKYDNAGLSKMYDRGELIEGYELAGEQPYKWEDLTATEFQKRMEEAGNVFNAPLVAKMSELFAGHNANGEDEKQEEQEVMVEHVEEKKPFWEVYTPGNVLREIKFRLTGS